MIYLDNNATTPLAPEALDAMLPFLGEAFGNASSAHKLGQRSRRAVEDARARVAALIGAEPDEIVFTSCGSEGNALALVGGAHARHEATKGRLNRIVVSRVEHDSMLDAADILRRRGFTDAWAECDGAGRVHAEEFQDRATDSTAVVSLQLANNEVGTLQPVKEVAAICRSRGVLSHTDAVQAVGKIPVDVKTLDVDLLTLSGHKFHGPKGTGALYVRRGVRLQPLIAGNHEKGRRGGTLNVAGIVGLGVAAQLARERMAEHTPKLLALRERLESGIRLSIEGAVFTGHPTDRLPNTSHWCFDGIEGHQVLIGLDLEGICVSAGPACSSGAAEPSHVLGAMGLKPELALGAVRFSLGASNTEAEIDRTLEVLLSTVRKLRKVRALL